MMSSSSEQIDIVHFEQQVASITEQLSLVLTDVEVPKSHPLGAISNDEKKQLLEEVLNQIYEKATKNGETELASKEDIRTAALEVRTALQIPSTRVVICRSLRAVTGKGGRELALEITKICLPLAIAGQIVIPVSALVWSILGFAVASIGVDWLCGDES